MPEDNNAVGFKTTLFGFRKSDVLACIDQMAAKSQEKEKEADTRELELQDAVNALKADKAVLLEKTREVCDQLTAQKKRTDEAEKKTASLDSQLRRAEEEAAQFKKRLFEKEKELRGLKNDNAVLNDRLRGQQRIAEEALSARHQAQQEMEQTIAAAQKTAQQQVAAAEETAQQQVAEAERNAQLQARQAKEAVQKEALLQKSVMTVGAQEIADSVSVLKAQLSEVDAKIAQAAQQLSCTTAALHTALNDAEENVKLLGAQMRQFPQPAPGAKLPDPSRTEPQQAASRAASGQGARSQGGSGKTLSALLLDKLTRMLGE